MRDMEDRDARATRWAAARRAARILAADPHGLGGIAVRARPGPALERWLGVLARSMGTTALKVNGEVADDRLLGGLDLAATLAAGRPVLEPGILTRADGGIVLVTGAERLGAAVAARIAAALDLGVMRLARDGFTAILPARFGVVALDEGAATGEAPPAILLERMAFRVDLDGLRLADLDIGGSDGPAATPGDVRGRWQDVSVPDAIVAALCTAAEQFGITAPRPLLLAVRAARAIAACDGKITADADAAREAAALVLAPRARTLPAPEQDDEGARADAGDGGEQNRDGTGNDDGRAQQAAAEALSEAVVQTVRAQVPPALLDELVRRRGAERAATGGRSQIKARSVYRGRQIGNAPGKPQGGARLDLIATLRAAAPWQRLRSGAGQGGAGGGRMAGRRVEVRLTDLRIRRHEEARGTLTVFVVDASGSSALHRLGEAKGAVEILLADCYVRRDSVALIAFKGTTSSVELPPTRSLTRAKRTLAGLPGGGGTPLAHALISAQRLADEAGRRGDAASIVLLTDCRANVALDGRGGRAAAEQDAISAARVLAGCGHGILLIDTAPRPHPFAADLGAALGARRLALPHAAPGLVPGIVAGAAKAMRRPSPSAMAGR